MSPQIRLMIAIRLSWLCKLGFLGKREEYIYMLRNVRRTHSKDKGEREIRFLESLRAQFSKQIRVHGSQGSAIITVLIEEGRTVHTVRRQFVQQEGGTISKEEVRTDRILLADTIPEADFVHLLLLFLSVQ